MSCDRVALYVSANGAVTYRVPVLEGRTPPDVVFRRGYMYSLVMIETTELLEVDPTPSERTTPK